MALQWVPTKSFVAEDIINLKRFEEKAVFLGISGKMSQKSQIILYNVVYY